MKHLWEVDHPYYCSESNYFAAASNTISDFKCWADFIAEWGDADEDYNLLFRWDWHEGPDWDKKEFNGDVNYRNGEFLLFWMGQRKGLFHCSRVEVCRADEPAIHKFLKPKWEHMKALWEPLSW